MEICGPNCELTDGNLWTKLHGALEFLQDVCDALNLRCVCQQLVLRMLKLEQKELRRRISGDVIYMADTDKFLNIIFWGVMGASCKSHKKAIF